MADVHSREVRSFNMSPSSNWENSMLIAERCKSAHWHITNIQNYGFELNTLYISSQTLIMYPIWTDVELKHALIAYFEMLSYEKQKTPYNKAEINRALQKKIPVRNRKSIEYRWQNISSVLNDNNYPFVRGFKPAKNVGSNVKERIWKIIIDLNLLE